MGEASAVTADEIKRAMRQGRPVFFVNLRHSNDWDTAIFKARGALRADEEDLERNLDRIPRDVTIVVYCTCPGDGPSYRAARLIQSSGRTDVHPLIGGFKAYLEEGLPTEIIDARDAMRKTMFL